MPAISHPIDRLSRTIYQIIIFLRELCDNVVSILFRKFRQNFNKFQNLLKTSKWTLEFDSHNV